MYNEEDITFRLINGWPTETKAQADARCSIMPVMIETVIEINSLRIEVERLNAIIYLNRIEKYEPSHVSDGCSTSGDNAG